MKSIYIQFNEALAALKKIASATKNEEVINSFREGATVETKINIVVASLAEVSGLTVEKINSQLFKDGELTLKVTESNVEPIDESKRDFAFFGLEPRKEVIKENLTRPIKKNNGAADNGHGEAITEVDRTTSKKEALVKSVMKSENISEAEARGIVGLRPKGPEGLDKKQAQEYRFARAIGLSESDAMVVAKLTPIREVNTNPRY